MERLASIGYTGIEGAPTDGSLDDVRRMRERLDALGLEVVANRSQA
jgi:sugar phosphate isomerase/epimerase